MAGEEVHGLTPREATSLGIAIVHQHPAVLPDMTVLENLQVALPAEVFADGPATAVATRLLDHVGLHIDPRDRVEDLSVAQRHLVEIAKALAVSPKLLILDEPTAPLGGDAVELFFRLVRQQVAAGTSVVYITHRMAEVRELADRVTVLRDGRVRGSARVSEISDDELLSLILGRQLDSTFPPKHVATDSDEVTLRLADLAGPGFAGVSASPSAGRSSGWPVWSGTGRATCSAPSPDSSRSTGRSRSAVRPCPPTTCCTELRTCPRTGTPRASR